MQLEYEVLRCRILNLKKKEWSALEVWYDALTKGALVLFRFKEECVDRPNKIKTEWPQRIWSYLNGEYLIEYWWIRHPKLCILVWVKLDACLETTTSTRGQSLSHQEMDMKFSDIPSNSLALRIIVEQIYRLVVTGVLESVDPAENPMEWTSPIVLFNQNDSDSLCASEWANLNRGALAKYW